MPDFHEPSSFSGDPTLWPPTPLGSRIFCGVPQHVGDYTPRWGIDHLLWSMVDPPIPRLGARMVTEITDLFATVSEVCGLTFEQTEDSALAHITFGRRRGNRNGLDGRGRTLAYAYPPTRSDFGTRIGDRCGVWFDDDERWSLSNQSADEIFFRAVACHEALHTIGLDHGSVGSLMAPIYTPNIWSPQNEDVRRLVALYGRPKAKHPTPPGAPQLLEVEHFLDGHSVGRRVIWKASE